MKRRRSGKSPSRRGPSREPRKSILVVCEGAKTEPDYFKALRRALNLFPVEVEVVGGDRGSAPISVVNRAIELRRKRKDIAASSLFHVEFDAIWCVFDVEAPHPHESLPRALNKARGNGINVALSNPCFEYWYLLHFEKVAGSMTTQQAKQALKKSFPDYGKPNQEIFDIIYPHTTEAIARAEGVIRENHWESCREDLRNCNPATRVQVLVTELLKVSEAG